MRTSTALTLHLALALSIPTLAQQPELVANLVGVDGMAMITRTNEAPVVCTSNSFVRWSPLNDGDQLSSTNGGIVKVLFRSGRYEYISLRKPIIVGQALDPAAASKPGAHLEIQKVLLIAGRKMTGSPGQFIQPAAGAFVLATNVLIRWVPGPKQKTFTLKLRNSTWKSTLESPAQALFFDTNLIGPYERLQKSGTDAVLQMVANEEVVASTTFKVLSKLEEKRLRLALKSLEEAKDLQKDTEAALLARAGVYLTFKLPNNAADTLDELLELPSAKDNPHLLKVAIRLNEDIGDRPKVEKLEYRLMSLIATPLSR